MKTKSVFSILAFLGGLGILVAGFFIWKGDAANNVFTLNLLVSMLVYCLLMKDLLTPWIDLEDKSQKQIGSLGMMWFTIMVYAVAAVAAMLLFRFLLPAIFQTQLIVQLVLVFLLACGVIASVSGASKAQEVHLKEKTDRSGLHSMKSSMMHVQETLAVCSDIPSECADRIREMEDSLRFISPCDAPEAKELEDRFVKLAAELAVALPAYRMNADSTAATLQKMEFILKQRKNSYSN